MCNDCSRWFTGQISDRGVYRPNKPRDGEEARVVSGLIDGDGAMGCIQIFLAEIWEGTGVRAVLKFCELSGTIVYEYETTALKVLWPKCPVHISTNAISWCRLYRQKMNWCLYMKLEQKVVLHEYIGQISPKRRIRKLCIGTLGGKAVWHDSLSHNLNVYFWLHLC